MDRLHQRNHLVHVHTGPPYHTTAWQEQTEPLDRDDRAGHMSHMQNVDIQTCQGHKCCASEIAVQSLAPGHY